MEDIDRDGYDDTTEYPYPVSNFLIGIAAMALLATILTVIVGNLITLVG